MLSPIVMYYPLALLLGLLSQALLMRALEKDRWSDWVFYASSGLLVLFTFYGGGILLLAQGLIFLLPDYRQLKARRWFGSLCAAAVLFSPWFLFVVLRQASTILAETGAELTRSAVGFALGIAMSFYTFSVGDTILPWRPEAILGLAVVSLLLSAGLFGLKRRVGWFYFGLFAISITFMTGVITFVSVRTPFLDVPVRALFALPFFLLVVSTGWSVLGLRARIASATVLLLVWGCGISNYFSAQQVLNPIHFTPCRRAAESVAARVSVEDFVISDNDSIFARYFTPRAADVRHSHTNQVEEIRQNISTSSPPHVWLIMIGRDKTRKSSRAEEVRRLLLQDYHLEETEGLLPIDPSLQQLKNSLLGRESYANRLTIELYSKILPARAHP